LVVCTTFIKKTTRLYHIHGDIQVSWTNMPLTETCVRGRERIPVEKIFTRQRIIALCTYLINGTLLAETIIICVLTNNSPVSLLEFKKILDNVPLVQYFVFEFHLFVVYPDHFRVFFLSPFGRSKLSDDE